MNAVLPEHAAGEPGTVLVVGREGEAEGVRTLVSDAGLGIVVAPDAATALRCLL